MYYTLVTYSVKTVSYENFSTIDVFQSRLKRFACSCLPRTGRILSGIYHDKSQGQLFHLFLTSGVELKKKGARNVKHALSFVNYRISIFIS